MTESLAAGHRARTILAESVASELAELRASFWESRERRSNAALYTTASCPPMTCRYCGRKRVAWGTSLTLLDGHLRCMVDGAFVADLRELTMNRADLTYAIVGKALGLTAASVRVLFIHGTRI